MKYMYVELIGRVSLNRGTGANSGTRKTEYGITETHNSPWANWFVRFAGATDLRSVQEYRAENGRLA